MAAWLQAVVTLCTSWASASALSAGLQNWPPSDWAEPGLQNWPPSDWAEPQDVARLEQVAIKVAKDVKVLREIVRIHHGGAIQEEADLLQQPYRPFLSLPSHPSKLPAQLDVLAQKQPEHLPTRDGPAQPLRFMTARSPLTLSATPLRVFATAVPKSDDSGGRNPADVIFTLGGTVPMWLGILIEVVVLILFIICLCGMFFFLCGMMFNHNDVKMVDRDPELHELWLKWEPTGARRRAAKYQLGTKEQVCPVCEGSAVVGYQDCAACSGTGRANSSTCKDETHAQQNESFELKRDQMTRLLCKATMFKLLPSDEQDTLADAFVEARFAKGTKLCSQGDPYGNFWVIADGQASLIIDNKIVTTLGVGDPVGEHSFMRRSVHQATVIAHTDLTTLLLTWEKFQESGLHGKLDRVQAKDRMSPRTVT